MKMLHHEDILRWFTLTIETKTGFPCLKIANDVLAKLPGPYQPGVIESIRESLGLNAELFPWQEGPVAETFGFGNSLRKINSNSVGQTTYRLELPIIHQQTKSVCPECLGKKADEHGECHYCSGSGKESTICYELAYAVSASMGLLANALWLGQEIKRVQLTGRNQILTLNLRVERDMHGGSLCGDFSPSFINFLKSFGDNYSFEPAREAMIRAYQHMWKSGNPRRDLGYQKYQFRAWQNLPGNLMLDVPGDACGIHPSPYVEEIPDNEGNEWTCHNVDTPLQQLTLLTGLAAMCDLADKSR